MCDDRVLLKEFLGSAPNREIADLQTELACIGQEIARNSTPHFHWDQAIVGNRDRIFPPENQLHAWQGDTKVQETDAAHYLHFRPIILERRLDKQVIRKCFERAVPTYEAEGCIQSCIAFRLNSLIPCRNRETHPALDRTLPPSPIYLERPFARYAIVRHGISLQLLSVYSRRRRKRRIRRAIRLDCFGVDHSMVCRLRKVFATDSRASVGQRNVGVQHFYSREHARNQNFKRHRNALLGNRRTETIV